MMSQLRKEGTYLENTQDLTKAMTTLDPDVSTLVYSKGVGLPNKPIFSTTSPDNPLLDITAQEYLTLKRFANERNTPQRFKNLPGNSTAHENSLYAPREAVTTNPIFKTSYR